MASLPDSFPKKSLCCTWRPAFWVAVVVALFASAATSHANPRQRELLRVRPILECVIENADGSYTAHFGYQNNNPHPVTIPVGPANTFLGGAPDRGQPTVLQPGRTSRRDGGFTVRFDAPHWRSVGHGRGSRGRQSVRCPEMRADRRTTYPQDWDGLKQARRRCSHGFLVWRLGYHVAWAWAHSPSCRIAPQLPDAVDDAATTSPGLPVTVNVLENDVDPQGDTLLIERIGEPRHGDATFEPAGTITYTPQTAFAGVDRMRYVASDQLGATDSATLTVTVSGEEPPLQLRDARAGHTATLLADGSVLLAGGRGPDGVALSTAELIDPEGGAISPVVASMLDPRDDHSASLLPRGAVVVLGGSESSQPNPLAELYEQDAFLPLSASLALPRAGHSATVLLDGRVLLLGGTTGDALAARGETFDARADIFSGGVFDPHEGTFTLLPDALITPRSGHTATLLPSGQILVVGGRTAVGDLDSIELVDPGTGQSEPLSARLSTGRHGHTALLRPDGSVLILGGWSDNSILDSIEVFDPLTQSIAASSTTLASPRADHTATLLSDGVILIAGGVGPDGAQDSIERIEPLADPTSPHVEASLPQDGATDVVLNGIIGVRLSEPVSALSVNESTVTLTGPGGTVLGDIGIVEGGLYIFFVPESPLLPAASYVLTLAGVEDVAGNPLATTSLSFSTAAPPAILSIQPTHGLAGTLVTISGTGFGSSPALNQVAIGGVVATITAATPSLVSAIVPATLPAGAASTTLTTPAGVATRPESFVVDNPVPTVATLAPATVEAGSPAVSLTVWGADFTTSSVVTWGTTPLSTTFVSSEELTALLPAATLETPGSFDVTVTTPAPGGGTSLPLAFTVTPSAVAHLLVAPLKVTLTQNESRRFYATALGSDGSADDVSASAAWSSSDSSIASVSSGGIVTAGSPGATTLTVTLGASTASALVSVIPADPIPPDPATVAPPLDGTIVSTIDVVGEFLYTSNPPIQRGLDPEILDPARTAILRGLVKDGDGMPLPGARVTVAAHEELGRTTTRADGMFDMVVNGGGRLRVRYEKPGFLSADRQVTVPWQDFTWLPDVALVPQDPVVTPVDLTQPVLQEARGSTVTDESGARQAMLFFMPGTQATAEYADGTTQALPLLHVRATEYTVGEMGPQRMPAELPVTSAYTYAVELAAEEAGDAEMVTFSEPARLYLENFLANPVGVGVPLGFYNRRRGQWEAYDDGRIVAILAVRDGLAILDVDGDGAEDDLSQWPLLMIGDLERRRLAERYAVGQSVWRFLIPHFTAWDCNYAGIPPEDAIAPEGVEAESADECDPCDPTTTGSTIGTVNRTLGESLPITGTGLSLRYSSARVPGGSSTLKLKVSGDNVPASLRGIEVQVGVAGRRYSYNVAAQANAEVRVDWDGRDSYGRQMQGPQPLSVDVAYRYRVERLASAADSEARVASFGAMLGESGATLRMALGAGRPGNAFRLTKSFKPGTVESHTMGWWDASAEGLGGWTLDVQHHYDPRNGILFRGDGTEQRASEWPEVTATLGGTGESGGGGDGGPATQAQFDWPSDVVSGPDGSIYIADSNNHRVRRIAPDGIITTVAGTGEYGSSGDGGPAAEAQIAYPWALALGPDGALFIAELGTWTPRIRRVSLDGMIETIAGGGGFCNAETNPCPPRTAEPALGAVLGPVETLAAGSDGSIYLLDDRRVERVSPDGTLTQLLPGYFTDVATGPGDQIHLAAWNQVWRLRFDGQLEIVAGTDDGGYSGDGGPAVEAQLSGANALTFGPDGSLYLADQDGTRIRRVLPSGRIVTAAGTGLSGFGGDNAPAATATFNRIRALAFGPDGRLVVSDSDDSRIRGIEPHLPTCSALRERLIVVPDRDGGEVFVFDNRGRHMATHLLSTGERALWFRYGSRGLLEQLVDGDYNTLTVERDGSGTPTGIRAPGGQLTSFTVGVGDYLTSVSNPASETVQLEHDASGLLLSLTDPRSGVHTFTYDEMGRLARDEDPAGGYKALERVADGRTTVTTAMGRVQMVSVEDLPEGGERRTIVDSTGLAESTVTQTDGTVTETTPQGVTIESRQSPNAVWGMQSPDLAETTVRFPSGLTFHATHDRDVVLADPNDPLTLQQMSSHVTVDGNTWATRYDRTTGIRTFTSPSGRQMAETLDSLGRVTEERWPGLAPILYQYDDRGRPVTVTQGSRSLAITWDASNHAVSTTDSLLRTNHFTYDPVGRLTRTDSHDLRRFDFAYDANGNIERITLPSRDEHRFEHTPVDLESERYLPEVEGTGSTTSHEWNLDRQIDTVTYPDGTATGIVYDSAGRFHEWQFGEETTSFHYDPSTGRLAGLSASSGATLTFAYDGTLVTRRTWAGEVSGSVERTFDNHLRVASESVNGGHTVTYNYDDDGLLTRVGDLAISRDPLSGLLSGTTLDGTQDSYEYNEYGELSRYAATFGDRVLYDVQYARDDAGRIIRKTETIEGLEQRALEYRYDDADRLVQVIERPSGVLVASYSYDPNGNRLTASDVFGEATGTYNARDQLTTYGDATLSYSPRGCLARAVRSGGTTEYEFDARGELSAVTMPDGTRIGYVLDAANARVGKTVNGTLVQRRLYGSSEMEVVAEVDASGAVTSRYVFLNPLGSPAYMVRGGTRYRIISDVLGSARLVVDSATGEIVQQIHYDDWGNIVQDSNPGFQPFAFTGREWDPEVALYYHRARYYDPAVGRFISPDPVDFAGGFNAYAYADNRPVQRVDPDGFIPIDTIWDIGSVIYDAGKIAVGVATDNPGLVADGTTDLLADVAATAIPYVPAGGTKLARALAKASRLKKGQRAHHLVARCAKKAEEARARLKKFGIDIDDPDNGAGLPKKFHEHLHTNDYYDAINRQSRNWGTQEEARQGMRDIAAALTKAAGE